MNPQSKYHRRRLGEILLEHEWVTPEQLEAARIVQQRDNRYIGNILVDMGVLQRAQLAQALTEQRRDVPQVSAADLKGLPPDVARFVPEMLARRFNVIAVKRDESDGSLTLAMENPNDLAALDLLSHVITCPIESVKAAPEEIANAIDSYYGQEFGSDNEKKSESLEDVSLEVEQSAENDSKGDPLSSDTSDLIASAEETPVVKFVEALFREAVKKRASDVHIEAGEQTTNVRLRIDGVLQRLLTISRRMHPAVVSRIKILSGLNIAERRLPQDGRLRLKFRDREVDVRVSTLPTVYGEKVVMRILDRSQVILDMEKLGISGNELTRFKDGLQAPYGMILLSGPTGSGKTTTLYAALTFLNDPTRNIVTVEDPVEYEVAGIGQVQVRPDIELTFARCLRHILRQDPDVIMVGEMRDLETTQIAIRSALTGHLVLSTLHANNSPAVVGRLLDIGIPPYLITASLNIAMAQRLLRRLCIHCKEAYRPADDVLLRLGYKEHTDDMTFFKAVGCESCDYTGYRGREGVYEIMPLTPAIKTLILEGRSEHDVRNVARQEGMKTLGEQGMSKVLMGMTSIEEQGSVPMEDSG